MTYDDILTLVKQAIMECNGADDVGDEQSISEPVHRGGCDLDWSDRAVLYGKLEQDFGFEIEGEFATPARLASFIGKQLAVEA
jgi:acyl carrier protein